MVMCVCDSCGQTRKHYGHGLCKPCYYLARSHEPDFRKRKSESVIKYQRSPKGKRRFKRWRDRNRDKVRGYEKTSRYNKQKKEACMIVRHESAMADIRGDDESVFKDKEFLKKLGLVCG